MSKYIIMAGLAVFTAALPPMAQKAHAQVSVSFQVFYDQLSPFGTWVSYPDYGYVWVPSAGSGFRPYGSRGHWVYTDDGWAWVSDYSWGWATFHYGNWFYDDAYGWLWVPGYEWAPAWVTWGEYGGNYCWAPIGPRVDIGVSFSTYRPPARYWVFCPRTHITSVNISNYYVRNTTVVNNITVINNVSRGGGHAYLRGPQAANVERFTHTSIRPVAVRPAARPGAASVRNGQLAIYRPAIQNNNAGARPAQVRDLHSLRPVNNHAASVQPRPASQPRATSQPRPAPQQPRPMPQQHAIQPRPAPQQQPAQPRPVPQQHTTQPRPVPQQPRPMPQPPPRSMPQQHPVQPRPVPQQHAVQPRPVPQQHPAQPRPVPQQPRPVPPPHQNPPPHDPNEHHR